MGGMWTFFTTIIVVLLGGFCLFLLAGGILAFTAGRKRIGIGQKLVGVFLLLTGLQITNVLLGDPFEPAASKARHDMKLPPEAAVVRYEDNDTDLGGGTIYFTLPYTRTTPEWFALIWKANVSPCDSVGTPLVNSTEKMVDQWSARCQTPKDTSGWKRELDYDTKTREYRYVFSAAD